MTAGFRNWQAVRNEVLRRIHAREWAPGDLIPNEADLAVEFGCARATVNRALQAVAEAGLLDRRRRAGTRVTVQPAARAMLSIPVIRQEIEARGAGYGYHLLDRDEAVPPAQVRAVMASKAAAMIHVRALHLADDVPYALEDRWIDTQVVPEARTAPFDTVSANEWLLHHAPYTRGDITFSAACAGADAAALGCAPQDAVFVMDRVTWDGDAAITSVRLVHAPGHRLRTQV